MFGHSDAAVVGLLTAGAVLADTHDEWQAGDRRYLSDTSMAMLYPERDTDPIAELNTGDRHRESNLETPTMPWRTSQGLLARLRQQGAGVVGEGLCVEGGGVDAAE